MFSSDRLEKSIKVAFEHGTAIWHGLIFQIADRCLYLSARLGATAP